MDVTDKVTAGAERRRNVGLLDVHMKQVGEESDAVDLPRLQELHCVRLAVE